MTKNSIRKAHTVEIDTTKAQQVIEFELGQSIKKIEWFKNGYASRAGLIEDYRGQKIVAKFGINSLGYKKDDYAAKYFLSSKVPIPKIKKIKLLDNGLWLCLSEHVEGITSDELNTNAARAAILSVEETLVALHSTNINLIKGYGDFDENGQTPYSSWAEFLTDDFCSTSFYQDKDIDHQLIKQAWKVINQLAQLCPTSRFLVHEDFGSDNLLIKDNKVVAVLDWQSALVGDWAMDVARCQKYNLEIYGNLKLAHMKAGFDCSRWDERINCYNLRSQVGLINWIWNRKKQGIEYWHLNETQNDLRKYLLEIKGSII